MSGFAAQRAGDRDELLISIEREVYCESGFLGAWLKGSIGRREHDHWSDLDLWVVLSDEEFGKWVERRYEKCAKFGEMVLTVEAPQNGPPGGIYFMAGYDFGGGLQLVDLYVQPMSAARQPDEALLLEMREEMSQASPSELPPLNAWNATAAEDASNCGNLAWAMLAIQAKYVARTPDREGLEFQEFIGRLIDQSSGAMEPTDWGDASAISDPAQKVNRLSRMATELAVRRPDLAMPADSVVTLLLGVKWVAQA